MRTILRNAVAAVVTLLSAGLIAGCDGESHGAKSRKPGNMSEFMAGNGLDHPSTGPVMRVVALSPLLPEKDKQTAISELESELDWIINHAPEGSETALVDALNCRPIASLKAVKGVARIRKKALAPAMQAIGTFLGQRPGRAKADGRVHLPHLAQTLAQLRLPQGTHVVLLGSPLFKNDAADKFFDMTDGRVPSDGMLFEDPKLSVFSVIGRERALQGQFWHIGFAGDDFVDDTHQQRVQRFNGLYLEGMGATLVTHQPSFVAAMEAARENRNTPLSDEKADASAVPEMIKVIKDIKQGVRNLESKSQETGLPGQDDAEAHAAGDKNFKREDISVESKSPLIEMDEHGNPAGSSNDLGGTNSLKGTRILIATFDHDPDVENSPLPDALRAKGATVERVRYPLPQPASWRSILEKTDQLWIWSSGEASHLQKQHAAAIIERWQSGKLDLCLLADNEPYTREAAGILAGIIPGSQIKGDFQGEEVIGPRINGAGPGFDSSCKLFSGLEHVFEGNTISSPSGKGLVPVCWASDGRPLLATFEKEGSSRLAVFGGFTSFYGRFWNKAGTPRLAVNLAAWLDHKDQPRNSKSQSER